MVHAVADTLKTSWCCFSGDGEGGRRREGGGDSWASLDTELEHQVDWFSRLTGFPALGDRRFRGHSLKSLLGTSKGEEKVPVIWC